MNDSKIWKGANKFGEIIFVWEWFVDGKKLYRWSTQYSDGSGGREDWSPSYRSATFEAKCHIKDGDNVRMKRVNKK